MSKHRTVKSDFWDDDYIVSLSPLERDLFLYLMTNEKTNIAGIYDTSIRRIQFDTSFDCEFINTTLNKFSEKDKIHFVDGYIIMVNHLKHNIPNKKIIAGIRKIIEDLPNSVKSFILSKKSRVYDRLSIRHLISYLYLNKDKDKDINKNKDNNENKNEIEIEEKDGKERFLEMLSEGMIETHEYLLRYPEPELKKDAKEVIWLMRKTFNPSSQLPPSDLEINMVIKNWILLYGPTKEELIKMINGAGSDDFEIKKLNKINYILNPEHKMKLLQLEEKLNGSHSSANDDIDESTFRAPSNNGNRIKI